MSRIRRPSRAEKPFICTQCGQYVDAAAVGISHRNHCPACLWSKHEDVHPGDRSAGCGGMMQPISIAMTEKGEWSLVHRCRRCGALDINTIAGDDSELVLMSLAVRPLARPPFPLHILGKHILSV